MFIRSPSCDLFFLNDPAPTEIYPLSLHAALPICPRQVRVGRRAVEQRADPPHRREPPRLLAARGDAEGVRVGRGETLGRDRKSTRLNSSHANISYAVFCLKKKKKMN